MAIYVSVAIWFGDILDVMGIHGPTHIFVTAALLMACGSSGSGTNNSDANGPRDSGPSDGPSIDTESAKLLSLVLSTVAPEILVPTFDPTKKDYASELPLSAGTVTLTATAMDPLAQVDIEAIATGTGTAEGVITLALGVRTVRVVVTREDNTTEAYNVALTRAAGVAEQAAYIKASNTDSGDFVGHNIALYGDTLAVSGYHEESNAVGINGDQEDNSAQSAGAVYVFVRSGETWVQEAYIKGSNTEERDRFGKVLALHGDTLAVGAYAEAGIDNAASNSGAAYVFTRTDGVWKEQAYIKASNAQGGDDFGHRIALSGDTLAVSTRDDSDAQGINQDADNNNTSTSGAVFIYTRELGEWKQEAYIKGSNTEGGDDFGMGLALYGDSLAVGADREDGLAVGPSGDDTANGALQAGAVYVFERDQGEWAQTAYLKTDIMSAGDNFGGTVTLYEDTLAASTATGRVYVFSNNDDQWTQEASLQAPSWEQQDGYGRSLSLFGDELAVGAPTEGSAAIGIDGDDANNDSLQSGAVHVFSRSLGEWTYSSYVKASNTGVQAKFGHGVALWRGTLAVGAKGEASSATGVGGDQLDDTAPGAGAAYIFD